MKITKGEWSFMKTSGTGFNLPFINKRLTIEERIILQNQKSMEKQQRLEQARKKRSKMQRENLNKMQ